MNRTSIQPSVTTAGTGVTTTVILPAYNEAQALPQVLKELGAILDERYEIVVVDDGSTDDTSAIAAGFPCRVIRHATRQGKGAAVRTGLANAHGQYLVLIDADASYPADAIPRITELLAQYDLVRCKRERTREHMPPVNRLGNWIFDRLLAGVHGLDGEDHLTGLYGLRHAAALQMDLQSRGFDIEAEIGIKAQARRLRVATFPIAYQPRLGEKKLRPWRDGLAILSRIAALVLLYNPMLSFVLPGAILMIAALLVAAALQGGPVVTPYFGLSIHSFIVATLGVLAAFQLVIFGIAAALYGVEAGYRPPQWLLAVSSRPVRLTAVVLGLTMAVAAAADVAALISNWLATGAGIFEDTRAVVVASTVMVWGLQILSAALFLSIFAGRLQQFARPQAHPVDQG
jgi:hypothetical protein